jgi:TolB-like protein/DNA-binding SARP family transcriptional activator
METGSGLGNSSGETARWSLHLFGGFELTAVPSGERVTTLGKRERVLLACLALSPNGRQQRRKLATLLWGDATDATLLDNLRTSIWSLRKTLGDSEHQLIASEGEEIALDIAAFDIDVLAFRRFAAQSGRPELEAAAALSTGSFLEGLDIESEDYESWRREEATRFRDQTIDVLNRLVTQLADSGETERAIEVGTRILRLEPLHEAAARRLMRLYAGSDRRGAAIEVYRTLTETLRTELNAQPKAETRAVFAEISCGEEEQPAAPADATPLPLPVTEPSAAAPTSPSVSWTAHGGHPGDVALGQRKQTHVLDRRPTAGRDKWVALVRSKWPIVGGIAAAMIAAFLLYQFVPPSGTTTASQNSVDKAKAVSLSPSSAIAIAVLPLVNLSSDPEQEFFSDGMTEEITTALAKISDLRVVGRTSAFQFKGQNQDLRAIGQALSVTHLLEGSVRKAGDRLRITAQLIKADDGTHVWTENYDRQLTDVFAIQEDIARAIAGALRMPLGLRPGENLVAYRPVDQETYELYLRGKAAVRTRNVEGFSLMQQVVARDPNFGPGWVWLARASGIVRVSRFVRGEGAKGLQEIESNETLARRAIALAPNYSGGYALLAAGAVRDRNWREAIEFYQQALARDPDDPEVLFQYGNYLRTLGYLKEALAAHDRAHLLEPLVDVYKIFRAQTLGSTGMTEAALDQFLRQGGGTGGGDYQVVAVAYARMGRFNEAAEALSYGGPRPAPTSGPCTRAVFDAAAGVLRAAANKSKPPAPLPDFGGCDLHFVYAYTSTPERILDQAEDAERRGFSGTRDFWWYAPPSLRKTERFKALVRSAGLVDAWRDRGWPDLCRPVGADDFVCD